MDIAILKVIELQHDLYYFHSADTDQRIDPSNFSAVQQMAEENRMYVEALRSELNMLRKIRRKTSTVESGDSEAPKKSSEALDELSGVVEGLQAVLMEVQEEQVKLTAHLSNFHDDTKEEFHRKQVM